MSSFDMRPVLPGNRQVIEAYGGSGFRVSGVQHPGSVFVFPTECRDWDVVRAEDLTIDHFAPLRDHRDIEILLLGCGRRMVQVPSALRRELRAMGVVLDAMDTGAACRTYNVLIAEERRVAAALIAYSPG
jgi:uncharacterized protein